MTNSSPQPPRLSTPRFSLDVESGFSPQSIEHRPSSINSLSASTVAAIHCASGSTNYNEAIALPGRWLNVILAERLHGCSEKQVLGAEDMRMTEAVAYIESRERTRDVLSSPDTAGRTR